MENDVTKCCYSASRRLIETNDFLAAHTISSIVIGNNSETNYDKQINAALFQTEIQNYGSRDLKKEDGRLRSRRPSYIKSPKCWKGTARQFPCSYGPRHIYISDFPLFYFLSSSPEHYPSLFFVFRTIVWCCRPTFVCRLKTCQTSYTTDFIFIQFPIIFKGTWDYS